MNGSNETPDQELFLVIQGLSDQLDTLLPRLRALSQAPEAGLLMGVDALYRADKDLALLCLRFDDALEARQRRRLIRLASQGGVPVLDPLRLSASDKDLFYQRHLRRYAVRIDDKKSPNSAIDALGQLLGLIELRASSESEATTGEMGAQRGHTDIPAPRHRLVLAPLRNGALGSESDVRGPQADFADESTETLDPPLAIDLDGMDLGPAGNRGAKAAPRAKTAPPAPQRRAGGKGKVVSARLATVPARPLHRPPQPTSSQPMATLRRPRATSAPGPAITQGTSNDVLRVRFARGDQWKPARLRNLSLKQIRLAASSAPPLTSAVRVDITLGKLAVTLPGIVVEVVNTESSIDGSTSFRVELGNVGRAKLDLLAAILRRAQADGLELSPPPARKSRRFAVSWPIAVISEGQRFNAAALDVSAQGLFLATKALIQARQVVFGIPLDTGEPIVRGRARVAREVTQEMADERQLERGYGLQFEALADDDLRRYEEFLVRVQQRSQLHVVVAGSSMASGALADCFQAAGYAVTRAASVVKFEATSKWDKGRPDIAVLDQSDLASGLREQFEERFEAHGIPMLHLHGHAPPKARQALDLRLSV
jgi:hypothetical protein